MKINIKSPIYKKLLLLTPLIILGFFISSSCYEEREGRTDIRNSAPAIPESVTFCGEKIPLENPEIRERLDRELITNMYYHSWMMLALKRAPRYFPQIERQLKENDIPLDFKFLSLIESNFANAVSSAGAVGFWQITEPTAAKYGLEVNAEVDERYNLERSTDVACRYLREAYGKYNSWVMAAASYNVGINGVNRQIEKQKNKNYFNLLFNEETSRYLFRILAVKIIFENPQSYGYYIEENDKYQPIETVEEKLEGAISNLADFAIGKGINYKILKMLNPWLRENALANKANKTYTIKLPKDPKPYMAE